jgi:hypothetical protein
MIRHPSAGGGANQHEREEDEEERWVAGRRRFLLDIRHVSQFYI